jgi:hypothetical protein
MKNLPRISLPQGCIYWKIYPSSLGGASWPISFGEKYEEGKELNGKM